MKLKDLYEDNHELKQNVKKDSTNDGELIETKDYLIFVKNKSTHYSALTIEFDDDKDCRDLMMEMNQLLNKYDASNGYSYCSKLISFYNRYKDMFEPSSEKPFDQFLEHPNYYGFSGWYIPTYEEVFNISFSTTDSFYFTPCDMNMVIKSVDFKWKLKSEFQVLKTQKTHITEYSTHSNMISRVLFLKK